MKKKIRKLRLDELVVERGLAGTAREAQALIMEGVILVDGSPSVKPGTRTPETAAIARKDTNPYVSRGGLKLEAVLRHFSLSVAGKTCLDIGASTGGFTDCLLQHGAKKVYALDVGKNLLHPRVRNDPRVVPIEGKNFRFFTADSLIERVEFVTIDVSFISLEMILPQAVQCLLPGGELVAMVKPQFEADAGETVKGVVKDPRVRAKAIDRILRCIDRLDVHIQGELDSPVKGPSGNIEHFIWMERVNP